MQLTFTIVSLSLAATAYAHGNIKTYLINGVTYPAWYEAQSNYTFQLTQFEL